MATPEPSRNKFTLELTSPPVIDCIITPTHATAYAGGTTSGASATKSSGNDDASNNNDNVSANRLAIALEATDDVILCGLSDNEGIDDDDDDDDDGDKQLFKSILADELLQSHEDDDFDNNSSSALDEVSNAVDPDLDMTQSSLEGLEKSAYDLEHWLEDMVSEL